MWCRMSRGSIDGYESDKIAHKLNKPPATVRRINRAGLDAIAAGLRRDDVAVF